MAVARTIGMNRRIDGTRPPPTRKAARIVCCAVCSATGPVFAGEKLNPGWTWEPFGPRSRPLCGSCRREWARQAAIRATRQAREAARLQLPAQVYGSADAVR